jgi:hypothetical protein
MSALAAANDLAARRENNSLLARALQLARECVGLERLAPSAACSSPKILRACRRTKRRKAAS